MNNFLTQAGLLLLFLALLALAGRLLFLKTQRDWQAESGRVRDAVLKHLRLPPEDPEQAARAHVLALVPCTSEELQGPLAVLAGQRIWLCFLADKLLVVSGSSGQSVALPLVALQDLYLVERAPLRVYSSQAGGYVTLSQQQSLTLSRADMGRFLVRHGHRPGFSFLIKAGGGVASLTVQRLGDMVRIVNVLIKQGVQLHYLSKST